MVRCPRRNEACDAAGVCTQSHNRLSDTRLMFRVRGNKRNHADNTRRFNFDGDGGGNWNHRSKRWGSRMHACDVGVHVRGWNTHEALSNTGPVSLPIALSDSTHWAIICNLLTHLLLSGLYELTIMSSNYHGSNVKRSIRVYIYQSRC